MKYLKSIHYLIFSILLSVLISVGCDTSESTDDGSLVGTWQLTSMSMTYMGMTIPIPPEDMMEHTITINADGTFTESGVDDDGPYSASGTWSTNGNVMTVTSPTEGTMTFNFSLSGNTLTLMGEIEEMGETISVTMVYTRV